MGGMKKYELILFDFDGTLVDTVGDIAYHANQVLVDFGHEVRSVLQVREAIGLGVHELLKELAPGFGDDALRLEAAVELFKKKYRENPVRETRPFPGVLEALRGSLVNTKKGIITNKPQDITQQILSELGLAEYFEVLVGMHAGFPPKPDPSGIYHAMERLGVGVDRTVYVGDSLVDAEAAQNAGVDFAWVSYGYDEPKKMEAVFRFSTATEWSILV